MMFCGGKTLSFEYNADGIRTEKTVSGEYTYTYRLDGDKVVEMVKDGVGVHNRYVFIYDNDGNPHALSGMVGGFVGGAGASFGNKYMAWTCISVLKSRNI